MKSMWNKGISWIVERKKLDSRNEKGVENQHNSSLNRIMDVTNELHINDPYPCPLNTLIGELGVDQSEIKEILISSNKPLFISSSLLPIKEEMLKQTLENHSKYFTWDYTDMRGIHPSICTNHIHTEDVKLVRQGQRRINPVLRDFVKIEIEKLLKVGFIYPIYDS